jgi:hypothetical protein
MYSFACRNPPLSGSSARTICLFLGERGRAGWRFATVDHHLPQPILLLHYRFGKQQSVANLADARDRGFQMRVELGARSYLLDPPATIRCGRSRKTIHSNTPKVPRPLAGG